MKPINFKHEHCPMKIEIFFLCQFHQNIICQVRQSHKYNKFITSANLRVSDELITKNHHYSFLEIRLFGVTCAHLLFTCMSMLSELIELGACYLMELLLNCELITIQLYKHSLFTGSSVL